MKLISAIHLFNAGERFFRCTKGNDLALMVAGSFVAFAPQVRIPGKSVLGFLSIVVATALQLQGRPVLSKRLLAYGYAARIPVAIVMFFAFLYSVFGTIEALQRVFAGVAAAAAGLVISMTGKMAEPLFERNNWLLYGVTVAAFVGVGVLRWPIWWVLLVLIPLSITIAWWDRR